MKRYRIENNINGKYYICKRWLCFWIEVKDYYYWASITKAFESLEDAEKWIEADKIATGKHEDKEKNFKYKTWYR